VTLVISAVYMYWGARRIHNLLRLKAEHYVTGDFGGESEELADSLTLPPPLPAGAKLSAASPMAWAR
jgi:hypothetical protein